MKSRSADWPSTEPMVTNEPPPARSSAGSPARISRKADSRFTRRTSAQAGSVQRVTGPSPSRRPLIPIACTMPSRPPRVSSASPTACSAPPGRVMSTACVRDLAPVVVPASIPGPRVEPLPGPRLGGPGSRSTPTARWPSRSSSSTQAPPIPPRAPATSTRRPSAAVTGYLLSAAGGPLRRPPPGRSGSSKTPCSARRARSRAAGRSPGTLLPAGGEGRGGACGLTHGHAGAHRAGARVCVMGGGEAAPCHQQALDILEQQAAVRDAVDTAVRNIAPAGVGAGVVVLDRGAAERDLVVEAAAGEHVLSGQPVAAVHPSALAHADRGAGRDHDGPLKAGDLLAKKARVFPRLTATLDLRAVSCTGSVASTRGTRVISAMTTPAWGVRCQLPSIRGSR